MALSIRRAGLFAVAVGVALAASVAVDPNVYLNDVKFLASNEMGGRATGSPALKKAAEFLAARYRELGLQPVAGNFFQRFLRGGKPVEADVSLTVRP
jgi:hypothetical protein